MHKQNIVIGFSLLVVISCLVSCAPAGYTASEAGFFSGILHGIVFFFALIGKLFGADIGLYAEHNTGFFYWLG
jgi:uncharacterized membrane protein